MAESPVMTWLRSGLPITLLCDLLASSGPDSAAINAVERPTGDPLWVEAARARLARAVGAQIGASPE